MKLVIMIPCLDEADTLPLVFEHMPREIPGVDAIDYLVVDDGSRDDTMSVARSLGVEHFVHHVRNMGLGQSFHDGTLKALEMGADIVVNTDGDNQYPSERIPDLIRPILEGRAEIVVADRQTHKIEHFSPLKKLLQRLGSGVVNAAAGTELPDAASGFRAYSREALLRLNTVTRFSYTMETIIQAGNKRLAIDSIPVDTNPKTRESRLFKSMGEHVAKSGVTIIRAYVMYRPMALFLGAASVLFVAALIPFVRFIVLSLGVDHGSAAGHLQSLIVGSVLMSGAFVSLALGVIADLIRINRILLEDSLEQQKRRRYSPEPLLDIDDLDGQWPRRRVAGTS
jgi:glycosyltransferase involved in cell wall biosynthesis